MQLNRPTWPKVGITPTIWSRRPEVVETSPSYIETGPKIAEHGPVCLVKPRRIGPKASTPTLVETTVILVEIVHLLVETSPEAGRQRIISKPT